MSDNPETYEKLNDYTLSVSTDFARLDGADPELRRIFNFRARQVTHIFSQWYGSGVSNSMVIQKFSELDSHDEVALMHGKLVELGGRPPDLADLLPQDKPAIRSSALRP